MGEVEASSREAAFLVVQSYGLFVISLVEKKTPFYKQDFTIFERVSPKDVVKITYDGEELRGGVYMPESDRGVLTKNRVYPNNVYDETRHLYKIDERGRYYLEVSDEEYEAYLEDLEEGEAEAEEDEAKLRNKFRD